jgi:hypothetical protein
VGNAVYEMSQYFDQSDVTLEYVSRNWLSRRENTCSSRLKATRGSPAVQIRT